MKLKIYSIVILLFFLSGCCLKKEAINHAPIKARGIISVSKETAESIGLQTEVAQRKKVNFQLGFNGIVKTIPNKTFFIASPVKGRLLNVYVEPNNQITKNKLLCEIASQDIAELQLNINEKLIELEGKIEEARLELSLAENTFNREQELFNNGITAKKEFLEAENNYKISKTNLAILERSKQSLEKLAEKRLSIVGSHLDESIKNSGVVEIVAPNNGIILTRLVNPGEVVDENKVLFEVSDLTEVFLESQVYEKDLPGISLGEEVTFTTEASPSDIFHGTLSYISERVASETRTVTVRAKIRNSRHKLKPEMFGTMFIHSPKKEAVVVNKSAIQRVDNQDVVYVETPYGFKEVKVKIGKETDSAIEILNGLKPNEAVVTSGSFWLKSELHND